MAHRIMLAVAALLMAALAGFGIKWHFDSLRVVKQELAAAQAQVQAVNKALTVQQNARVALQAKYNKQQKELNAVLDENRTWADGAVPDSVYRSLFDSTPQ